MTRALHTPQATAKGAVVNLSGQKVWRKQILPLGSINYEGRQIRFDSDYHKELVRNFRAGAYSQVPFQLADATNTHTNDPERTRGELVDLRAEPTGLYGYFKLSDQGQQVLLNNPNLGVSCRIIEGYTREADAKPFGKALQHVLGTLDPRVTGLKPWESVELASARADETVDLSNQFYTKDGGAMPDGTEDKVVVELSTAQLERLQAMLAEDEETEEGEDTELDFGNLNPEDFADGEDDGDEDADSELDDEQDPDNSVALAAVTNLQNQVIELTNRLETRDSEVELAQLAATGLAPAIIEDAKPLLAMQAGVVELANGDRVSPGRQVRKLLRTVLELSNRGMDVVSFEERGTIGNEADAATQVRKAAVDEMDRLYGS